MKKLLLASFALCALTTLHDVARAADMPVKVPVVAPVYSWTGFYVGANGGYGWGNRSASFTPIDPVTAQAFGGVSGSPLPNTQFHTRGGFGGLQAGVNWQLGPQMVAGLEADFDFGAIKGSGTSPNFLAVFIVTEQGAANVSENIKWFGTVRARLGYLVTNGLLLYGTGGFAYGRVDHDANYITSSTFSVGNAGSGFSFLCTAGVPCFLGSSSRVLAGWTAGAGAEWVLLHNLTFKAEYLYVNLGGAQTFPMTATATVAGEPTPSSIAVNYSRADFQVARVGLNYRFGDAAVAASY